MKIWRICVCAALTCSLLACASPVQSASLTVITWNAARLEGTDLEGFGKYVRKIKPDVVVLQELLDKKQVERLIQQAGISHWNARLSNFSKDSIKKPSKKLEVAILSPHEIGTVFEADPYMDADTKEMHVREVELRVPLFVPKDQHRNKGLRGWLWVEIPTLKIAVAAIHLKSAGGENGKRDELNSFKRENVVAALADKIVNDSRKRKEWSYLVAGDFNVAPGDVNKVGVDLDLRCKAQDQCLQYDQTHAILSSGLVQGLAMRNLTVGLGRSFVDPQYAASPIDNIYATGPFFDETSKLIAERSAAFGSDHYAIRVTVGTEK
ncbi:MAG: hypothetical protein OXL41_12160 [Nitrospinae bacterium]|nr:hypothetical protein [Nitrospinota bacterium]